MISVTPLTQRPEIATQRAKIIRTAIIAVVAMSAFAIAIARLAHVTGDMLSASVLALAGTATMLAILSPKSGEHSKG